MNEKTIFSQPPPALLLRLFCMTWASLPSVRHQAIYSKTASTHISLSTGHFASISITASRQGKAEITDSLINAAAMHHKPDTFLQWVIATADRVASGFEREEFERYNQGEDKTDTSRNNYQAR